jgi:hypothetical protein
VYAIVYTVILYAHHICTLYTAAGEYVKIPEMAFPNGASGTADDSEEPMVLDMRR